MPATPALYTHTDSTSGKATVRMTLVQAEECSAPGRDADPYVSANIGKVEWFAKDNDIRKILSEYGAWDDIDEASQETLRIRMLWCAAGDIRENPGMYLDSQPTYTPTCEAPPTALATAEELAALRGRYVSCRFHNADSAEWYGRVIDTRKAYGRVDCLVHPLGGCGAQWLGISGVTKPCLVLMSQGWQPPQIAAIINACRHETRSIYAISCLTCRNAIDETL